MIYTAFGLLEPCIYHFSWQILCLAPTYTLFPYTTLFRSLDAAPVGLPVLRLRRSLPGRGEPGGAADQLQQPVSGRADGPVTADPEKGSQPDPRHGPPSTEHFDQAALSRLAAEERSDASSVG